MKWVNYNIYIGIEENNSLKFIVSKKYIKEIALSISEYKIKKKENNIMWALKNDSLKFI